MNLWYILFMLKMAKSQIKRPDYRSKNKQSGSLRSAILLFSDSFLNERRTDWRDLVLNTESLFVERHDIPFNVFMTRSLSHIDKNTSTKLTQAWSPAYSTDLQLLSVLCTSEMTAHTWSEVAWSPHSSSGLQKKKDDRTHVFRQGWCLLQDSLWIPQCQIMAVQTRMCKYFLFFFFYIGPLMLENRRQ